MRPAPSEYYEDHYDGVLADAVSGAIPSSYDFFINLIRKTTARLPSVSGKRIIDIGCGPGYLLVDPQKRGFECYGIDFNPAVIKVAREKFGLNAEVKTVEELAGLKAKYDWAILYHVLEHVSQPAELLAGIGKLLNPNGVLMVEVPNPEYCRFRSALYAGKLDWGNYPPHHLTFWSPKSLQTALSRAGFNVLTCRVRPYPERLQMRHNLVRERRFPDHMLTTAAAFGLEMAGRAMRLSGMSIYAVARRTSHSQ
jgi:SAM-dependent methyltransferase